MRILLVDDDEAVRRSLVRLLKRDHEVVDVASPLDALALIRGAVANDTNAATAKSEALSAWRPHVLVTDFHMREMSGAELLVEVEKLDPVLARATVFVTGGPERDEVNRTLARLSVPVLRKPVGVKELRETLSRVAQLAASHT